MSGPNPEIIRPDLFGIPVIVSDLLPIKPGHREVARRTVRRGLHDAFPWLQGDPGPLPDAPTVAILTGGRNLLASADYAQAIAMSARPKQDTPPTTT